MAVELFPCLGLSFLGSCAYNPAQPSPVYFTIGDAVAALALTLAIQQFLKPIVVFRLRAYGLSIRYLILFAFVGFGCAIIAALLPNLPVAHDNLFEYPIFWELIGGALIGATYAVAAFIALGPARIYNFNLPAFVRAGAALLSSADDNDRVSFAEDLLRSPHNLARLINYAKAWEEADAHASALKFDELRQAGKPLSFQGRAPISAFYLFAHRRKLE
ncbi:MAG TPA: hypothetical protein VNF99_20020, partial [Stellaceae bacterium]|nr:hypothetical protein [Stellaceae bacterium]